MTNWTATSGSKQGNHRYQTLPWSSVAIGGGAYWARLAMARTLFGSCGPPVSLACPLFG